MISTYYKFNSAEPILCFLFKFSPKNFRSLQIVCSNPHFLSFKVDADLKVALKVFEGSLGSLSM